MSEFPASGAEGWDRGGAEHGSKENGGILRVEVRGNSECGLILFDSLAEEAGKGSDFFVDGLQKRFAGFGKLDAEPGN